MNELHSILDAWRGLEGGHRKAVLATVVHVSGSAYRRPGARMWIGSDGTRIGSVSGGCLESELAKRAWWLTESEKPALRVYDTSSDEDAVWEFGLGCNGIVQVLLERAESRTLAPALEFLDAHRYVPVVMATITASAHHPVGNRAYLDGGNLTGDAFVANALESEIRTAYRKGGSCFARSPQFDAFVEWIAPPQRLVVFGAGHDARPLVTMAKQLGWNVTVADGRPAYACAANFPDADRVVLFQAADPLAGLGIGEKTAVVLMTHNYPLDSRLLPAVLERKPLYLGLLGPKSRTNTLLAENGLVQPANIHGPAGLDLGGDTPASVALSILAEMEAVLNSRSGGQLRNRIGAIHTAPMESGQAAVPTTMAALAYCEWNA